MGTVSFILGPSECTQKNAVKSKFEAVGMMIH